MSSPKKSSKPDPKGIAKSTDKALDALKRMRAGMRADKSVTRKRAREEVSGLLTKKKRHVKSAWHHKFVCLAYKDQNKIPTSDAEKEDLYQAGLGERKISFDRLDISPNEFRDLLYHNFPRLKEGGGFQLLKGVFNSRSLEGLSMAVHASPSLLKQRVGGSKIYIRPLQRDLDITSVKDEADLPTEECLTCGLSYPLNELSEHAEECEKAYNAEPSESSPVASYEDDYLPNWIEEAIEPEKDDTRHNVPVAESRHQPIVIDPPVAESHYQPIVIDSPKSANYSDDDRDDAVLQVALEVSKKYFEDQFEPSSIADVVMSLMRGIDKDTVFDMVIRRSHILSDAMRRMAKQSFCPSKKITVEFVGEDGRDTGGLTREFFRLVFIQISAKYMQNGCFMHNAVAYQDNVYYRIGQLASMCLVQGGSSIRILSPSIYSYMCGLPPSDIIVDIDEVPDQDIKTTLHEIAAATTVEVLRNTVIQVSELIIDCGYTKPISTVGLEDKTCLIQTVCLHMVILKTLGELSQFKQGLQALGVGEQLVKNSNLLKGFFVNEEKEPLTADTIRKLLKKLVLSEVGSNQRMKEEHTYMLFLDYLEKCERVPCGHEHLITDDDGDPCPIIEQGNVSLEAVLSFFTGSVEVPPLGFPFEPKLNFNPTSHYPTSSTCAVELTLPTAYEDEQLFFKKLDEAFTLHGGFGLV